MGVLLRLALLGLIAWVVFRFLQRTFGLQISVKNTDKEVSQEPPSPQVMRRCAWCKVHVPEGESTQSGGQFFCSESHRDAWLRGKP